MTLEDQQKSGVMAKTCWFSECSKWAKFDLAVLNRDNSERFSASEPYDLKSEGTGLSHAIWSGRGASLERASFSLPRYRQAH